MTPKQYLKEAEKIIFNYKGKILSSHASSLSKGLIVTEYQVPTKLGPLNVTPYKDWIALRFQDLSLAQDYFPISSTEYSRGKWNIQGVSKQGKTIAEYRQEVLRILKKKLEEVKPYVPF